MGLTGGDMPQTRSNKRPKSQIDIYGFRVSPLFSAGSNNDFPTLPDSLIYLFSVVKKRNGKKNSRWRQKKKKKKAVTGESTIYSNSPFPDFLFYL